MDYKPSDLFVSVVDVFAILLPGALLAFVMKDVAAQYVFGTVIPPIKPDDNVQNWVAFVFAAYLLGHFIFLVGAFLDHRAYDPFRRRWLSAHGDTLYLCATELKNREFQSIHGMSDIGRVDTLRDAPAPPGGRPWWRRFWEWLIGAESSAEMINTFKWARAKVQMRHPTAAVEISRLEADSKFFRSLIVVLVIIAGGLVYKGAWLSVAACFVLVALAFFRYADQRFKSTQLAYIYVVAMAGSHESQGTA